MLIDALFKKIFGSRNERVVRKLNKMVMQINALESTMQKLSNDQLMAKTEEFRQRLKSGQSLDAILPEAFAVVREASVRTLGLRHFDVQLIGGMVLHGGSIAEMGTGEGKTLVGTLPVYLNALSGDGVHIITVNDYLAKRDAEWMRPIYEFLGLTVGINLSNMPHEEKQAAYQADVTYGTNNEFGFDYLRDNMAFSLADKVQRKLNFAIVDEVDSILIDEARTPLIISGMVEESSQLYQKIYQLVPQLVKQEQENGPGDYFLDEKSKQAHLTDEGHNRVEGLLTDIGLLQAGESLYSVNNIPLMHHLYACLRAHTLFNRDVEYIVHNNQIVIVDEHTGRTMPGRRWSDGLHQAVEAKEGVPIQNENQTLASITFQNYFRMYDKLAGMTGTADTEAYEFQQIYGLEVVVIPTNKPVIRKDHSDKIYLTQAEKFEAIIADIKDCVKRKQPVLVGTASIETSEYLSGLLKKEKIAHQVLNAKYHEQEAQIIAQAGSPNTVTIATNMAGRGTDIVLGGNLQAKIAELQNPTTEDIAKIKAEWQQLHDQVVATGGLHVIGSERHEARRIDNQLRGRSGRQGDAGSTRFYLSLQDNLMRIFASDRMAAIMQRLGMKEGEPIEHAWINRAIENAQRKVEGHNFDIRKQLLEFDDVANEQRKLIYEQRAEMMALDDVSASIKEIRDDVVTAVINQFIPPQSLEEQWDIPGLERELLEVFDLKLDIQGWLEKEDNLYEEQLKERILTNIIQKHEEKEARIGSETMRQLEKALMLQTLDINWKEHLAAMEYLRQGIHLRGYAQKNPKQEYKREAFELFTNLLDRIKHNVISLLMQVEVQQPEQIGDFERQYQNPPQQIQLEHPSLLANEQENDQSRPDMNRMRKVGRNEVCPCGSGKKYKHCHGQIARTIS